MNALFLLIGLAQAGETSVWSRQLVGVGAFPLGALSDTRVQVRTPGHRSDSVLFQNTFYGAGARLQVSPAFVDIGPRVSIAPIDVFDLDLQASWTGYAGPFGPLPFDGITGSLESTRNLRNGEEMAMYKWELSAAPTFKVKVGPIIAFDSTTLAWMKAKKPADVTSQYWYEPYRDLVVAWEDVTLENQGAVLGEILPGGDKPKLLIGGTMRHRRALRSKDHQTNGGLLVVCKPGVKPVVPTLILQAMAWISAPDRVGTAPSLNLAASWTFGDS